MGLNSTEASRTGVVIVNALRAQQRQQFFCLGWGGLGKQWVSAQRHRRRDVPSPWWHRVAGVRQGWEAESWDCSDTAGPGC